MSPAQLLSERILILLEMLPKGCHATNLTLSVLLKEQENFIAEVIQEMIETGLIYRWLDDTSRSRVLSLSPKIENKNFCENQTINSEKEEKKVGQRKEEKEALLSSCKLSSSITLLRRVIASEISKPLDKAPFATDIFEEENKKLHIDEEETLSSRGALIVPGIIKEVVTFWNEQGLKTCKIGDTKIFNLTWDRINRARRGTLLRKERDLEQRKFTNQDILNAIRNFKLAAFEKDYDPPFWRKEHYRKITLSNFLYNDKASSRDEVSLLLKYQQPPRLSEHAEPLREDKYPQITAVFKKYYQQKVLKNFKTSTLTNREENKFRLAAEKTADFFTKNRNKFITTATILGGISAVKVATLVCEAIEKSRAEFKSRIFPGNFCSDHTFNYCLPVYLAEQGIWEE